MEQHLQLDEKAEVGISQKRGSVCGAGHMIHGTSSYLHEGTQSLHSQTCHGSFPLYILVSNKVTRVRSPVNPRRPTFCNKKKTAALFQFVCLMTRLCSSESPPLNI